MIPIRVSYSNNVVSRFGQKTSWFSNYLVNGVGSEAAKKQTLILATNEYADYLECINDFYTDILDAFSGVCAYCNSEDISTVLPIHPIEKSRWNPQLPLDIYNIYPFCSYCKKIVSVVNYKYEPDGGLYEDLHSMNEFLPNILIPTTMPSNKYISIDDEGYIVGKNSRAKRTISNSGVNREEMRLKRLESEYNLGDGNEYYRLWKSLKPGRPSYEDDYTYAVSISSTPSDSQLLDSVEVKKLPDPFEWIEELETIREIDEDKSLRLKRFSGTGVRLLRDFSIDLDARKCLGVIGENGVGKSTLLRYMSASVRGTGLSYIRKSSDGFISDAENYSRVELVGEGEYGNTSNEICSSRLAEGVFRVDSEVDQENSIRVAYVGENRADGRAAQKISKWMVGLNDIKFDLVSSQIKHVLSLGDDVYFERDLKRSSVFMIDNGRRVSVEDLSSGYRSVLNIIYGVFIKLGSNYQLNQEYIHLDDVVGVVFIDEIDLHLHPLWKINIIRKLKEAFSDIFFVFTTHDPLVLKGCSEGEVLLLKQSPGRDTKVYQDLPDISKYGSDMLLTSNFFGLADVRDIDVSNDLASFYQVISSGSVSEEVLEGLKSKAMLGTTYRENIANLIVDMSLSRCKNVDLEEALNKINGIISEED